MQHTSMSLATLIIVAAVSTASGSMLRKASDVPKKEPVIKNPADGVPIGDVLPDAKPPTPRGQQYNHMYGPVSPPHAKDLSPTDPSEYLSDWQGQAANMLDNMGTDGRRFEGSTCESVCAACSIWSAQQVGGMCFCQATCKMGECGNGARPHIGWSNNEVTTPDTRWLAKCNVGEKNCEAQCLKEEFKKSVKECQDAKGNPTECFRKLTQRNQPLPMDARKQVHWCARKGMAQCDSFMNAPAEKGWRCYMQKDLCDSKARNGFKLPMQRIEAPSVWESVAGR